MLFLANRKYWIFFHQPLLADDIYGPQFKEALWCAALATTILLLITMSVVTGVRVMATLDKSVDFKDLLSWTLGSSLRFPGAWRSN